MRNSFWAHIREFYRKMRIRMSVALPALAKATASAAKGAYSIIMPCAGVLILFEILQSLSGGVAALVELIKVLIVFPAAAAAIVYAVDAVWEKRMVTPTDAVHLVRIRAKQILITGAAAWLIVMAVRSVISMVLMFLLMFLGSILALLSMMPFFGVVFTAIGMAASWLLELLVDYASHAALMVGMLVLIADGIGGRPQFDRSFSFVRNGGKRLWEALILLFGAWVVVGGAGVLFGMISPVLGAVVSAVLTACSMTAMCVIYLRERDGVSFC